ncbi:titin [Drosophila elegans]|uniref:titin n=1 Tax=Drosophila elegans TaxID=30023 RepID=UPI0007E8216C|nr:titin [Drosophila elegans]
MSLEGARLRYEDENGQVVVLAAKGRTFQVGSYFNCDLTIEDPQEERLLCEIKCDAFGRVNIYNKSSQEPIHLNDQEFYSCNGKRPLLHGCRITIRDKVYTWEFPKSSETQDEPSTPKSTTLAVEQASNSCPAPKQSHRPQIDKRLTVHNFNYSINSDDEGNTSIESRDQNESLLEVDSLNISTPPSSEITACETPKVNLLDSTQNKENTATPPGSHLKLLQLCARSDVVITSFSPRETGVKVEKSFTCVRKPVKAASVVSTPKSVYSTPKGGVLSELNEDSCSRDLMDFSTPSTSQKAKRASSMYLIDLTTPSKLRPTLTPKQTPTSITVDSTDESSDASPLVIDITNSATPPPGPSSRNNTPRRPGGVTGATPKRTPQSLMKRALLTSTKKQITANQTDKTTPVANAKRPGSLLEARRQCLTTPRRLPFHPVRRTPVHRLDEQARGNAPKTSPRKRKSLMESPRDNKVSQLRKSFAAAKRSPGVDKSNKLVAKARRSLNSPKSASPKPGSSKPASPCPINTFSLPQNKCSTPEKLDDSKDELSRTFTIMDETEGREQSGLGTVFEAVAALVTGEVENEVSFKLASEVFDKKSSSVEEDVKSEEEEVNSRKDDAILDEKNRKLERCDEDVEPNDIKTANVEEVSTKSPVDSLQDKEKTIPVNEKLVESVIEDSICEEVHANIPEQTNNASSDGIIEDQICEEVALETKSTDVPVELGKTSQKVNEQTPNVETPVLRRSLRRLSVDQRALTTTPRRSTRRSSVDTNKKTDPQDNIKRTRRASCSAVESQDLGTPRRKRRFTQEMSTPTRHSKRLINTPKREHQVDESVGDMGVILEEDGPADEEKSAIADDENYGNELPVDNADKVDYHGLKDLLKTPKNCSTPRFKGLREMMRTPKIPDSPILGNLAELLETSAGSTPYHKSKSITVARVEQGNPLEGILKTPSARNIMVPNEPASAVLKSREDSLATTTEYDLNMTNNTLHLDKIFDDMPETTGTNLEDTEAEINVTAISTATGGDPLGSSKLNDSVSSEALMTGCNTATMGNSLKDPLTSTTYKASMQADLNLSAFRDGGSRTTSPNPNEMSGIQLLDQTSDSMFSEPLIVTGVESCDVTVDETRTSGQTIQPADHIEDRSDTDSNVGLTEPLVFSDDEEEQDECEGTPKKPKSFGETSTAYKLQETDDLIDNKSVVETSVKEKDMDSNIEVSLIEVEDSTTEGSINVTKPADDEILKEKSLIIELDISKNKEAPGQENNESAVEELTILESEIFPLDTTTDSSVIPSNVSSCSVVDILPNVDVKAVDSKTTNLASVKSTEVVAVKAAEKDVCHLDQPQSDLEKNTDVECDKPLTETSTSDGLPEESNDLSLKNTSESNEPVIIKSASEKCPEEPKLDDESTETVTDQSVIETLLAEQQTDKVSTNKDRNQSIIESSPSQEYSEDRKSDELSTEAIPNQPIIETLSANSQTDLPLQKTTNAATGDSVGQEPELLPKDVIAICEATPVSVTTISAIDREQCEDQQGSQNEPTIISAEETDGQSKAKENQEESSGLEDAAKNETCDESAQHISSPSSTDEIQYSEVVDSSVKSTGTNLAAPSKDSIQNHDDQPNVETLPGAAELPNEKSLDKDITEDIPKDFTLMDTSTNVSPTENPQISGQGQLSPKTYSLDKTSHIEEKEEESCKEVNSAEEAEKPSENGPEDKEIHIATSVVVDHTPIDESAQIDKSITDQLKVPILDESSSQLKEPSNQAEKTDDLVAQLDATSHVEETSLKECSLIEDTGKNKSQEDSNPEESMENKALDQKAGKETDEEVIQLDASSIVEHTSLDDCSPNEVSATVQPQDVSILGESSSCDQMKENKELDKEEVDECGLDKDVIQLDESSIAEQNPLDESLLTEEFIPKQSNDINILKDKTKQDEDMYKEEAAKSVSKTSKQNGADGEVIDLNDSNVVEQSILVENSLIEHSITDEHNKVSILEEPSSCEKTKPISDTEQQETETAEANIDKSSSNNHGVEIVEQTEESNVLSNMLHASQEMSVDAEVHKETVVKLTSTEESSETGSCPNILSMTAEVSTKHNSDSRVNESDKDQEEILIHHTSAPEIELKVPNSNDQESFVRQTEEDVSSAIAVEQEASTKVQETVKEAMETQSGDQQIDDTFTPQKKPSEVTRTESQVEVIDLDDSSSSAQGPETTPLDSIYEKEFVESKASPSLSVALPTEELQVSDEPAKPTPLDKSVTDTDAKISKKTVATMDNLEDDCVAPSKPETTQLEATEKKGTLTEQMEVIDLEDSSSSAQRPETTSIQEIVVEELVASNANASVSFTLPTDEPQESNNEPAPAKESVTLISSQKSDTRISTSESSLDNLEKDSIAPSEAETTPLESTDKKVMLTEQMDVIDLDDSSSSAQEPATTPLETIDENILASKATKEPQVPDDLVKHLTVVKNSDKKATTSNAILDIHREEDTSPLNPETTPLESTDEKVTLTKQMDVIDLDDSSSSAQGPATTPPETIDENILASKATKEPQVPDDLVKHLTAGKDSDRRATTSNATLDIHHEEDISPLKPETSLLESTDEKVTLTKQMDVIDLDDSSSSAQGPESTLIETIDDKECGAPKASTSFSVSVVLPSDEPQVSDELAKPASIEENVSAAKKYDATLDNLPKEGVASPEPETMLEMQDQKTIDKPVLDYHAAKELSDQRKTDHGEIEPVSELPNSAVVVVQEVPVSNAYAKQSQINTENKPSEELDQSTSDLGTENKEKVDLKMNYLEEPISGLTKRTRKPSNHEDKFPYEGDTKPANRVTRKGSVSSDRPAEAIGSEKPKKRARKPSAEVDDHEKDNKQEDDVHVKPKGRARKPSAEVDESKQEDILEKRKGRSRTPSTENSVPIKQKEHVEGHKAEEVLQPILEEEAEPQETVQQKPQEPVTVGSLNVANESKLEKEDDDSNQKESTIEKSKRRGRKASAKETDPSSDKKENTKFDLEIVSEDGTPLSTQEIELEQPVPMSSVIEMPNPKEDEIINQKNTVEKPKRRGRKPSAKETETTSLMNEHTEDDLKATNKDKPPHSNQDHLDGSEQQQPQEPLPVETLEKEPEVVPEKPSRRARKASEDVSLVPDNKHKSDELHSIEKQKSEDLAEVPVEKTKRRGRKPSAEVLEATGSKQQDDNTEETKAEAALASIEEESKPQVRARKSAEFLAANVQEATKDDHIEKPKRRGRKPSVDIDHVAQEALEKPKRRGKTPAEHDKEDEKQEPPLPVVGPEKKTRRNARKASAETIEAVSTSGEEHLQQIAEATEPDSESEPAPINPLPKEAEEEAPIKTNSPEKTVEIPSHSRRRGRKATEDEGPKTADIAEPKPKLRGRRVSLDQEHKEDIPTEVLELPAAKPTRRGRKPSADVETTPLTAPEKKVPLRRARKASANVDDGTPVAKKTTHRRGRKEDVHEEEQNNQIDLQNLSTENVPATVVTISSPSKTSDGEELTPRRREGRNLPRKNYEEAPDEDKPHSASRRARKPAASKGLTNKAPEQDALTATPITKQPPILAEDTPDTSKAPEQDALTATGTAKQPAVEVGDTPISSQRREGRNLPRKNYTEVPDDDKPTSARSRRVRNLTAKALELIVDSSPRPATPKRPKVKAVEDEEPPVKKATPESPPPAEAPAPAAKGRATRRKADDVTDASMPASKRGARDHPSETEESDPKPAKKNVRATARKVKAKVETEPEEHPPTKKARGGARAKTPVASAPEDEPAPAAKGRATRRKADDVADASAPASKRLSRGHHSDTEESDPKPAKRNVRATARKAKVETDSEEHPPTKKTRGGSRAKTPVAETSAEASAANQEEEPVKKPAARSRARGAKAVEPEQPVGDTQVGVAASTSAATVRGGLGKKVHFEAAPEVSTRSRRK